MYADELTDSMEVAIKETKRRRKIQEEYNKSHGIIPQSIKKDVRDSISHYENLKDENSDMLIKENESLEDTISRLTEEMMNAARKYEFEKAANIRDLIRDLQG